MGNSATVLQSYQPSLLLLSLWSLLKSCMDKTFPLWNNYPSSPSWPLTLASRERQVVYGYLSSPLSRPPTSVIPKHVPYSQILKDTRKSQRIDRWCRLLWALKTEGVSMEWRFSFFLIFVCVVQISPKWYSVKLFKHCRLCCRNLSGTQKRTSFPLCQNWWSWRGGGKAATSEMALWIFDGAHRNSHRSEPKTLPPPVTAKTHLWLKKGGQCLIKIQTGKHVTMEVRHWINTG